jgi:long-chain acyl-CoA synthetase
VNPTSPTTLSGPPLVGPVAPHLLSSLWRWAEEEPNRPLLAVRDGGEVVTVSAVAFRDRTRAVAAGLIARGVAPGDRVALLSRTSLAWVEADHGILAAAAVTVPIYDSSSASQIERIVTDSGAVLVIVETPEQRDLVVAAMGDRQEAPPVLVIAEGGLEELAAGGADHLDVVEQRLAGLGPQALATLIYSSGTTGEAKGCELTHGNLCHNVRQTVEQAPELFGPGARTLAFLPLAHALGRIQVHTSIDQGALTAFATGIPELPEELLLFRPTFIVAVPRIFEKVYDGARNRAIDAGRVKVFDRAMAVAVRRADARRDGRAPVALRLQHALFDRLVYRRLRAAFGGELRMAICGGAALSGRLARCFDGMGIVVAQGYGLTEAAPIVSGGPDPVPDHDSVGRPYPATTVTFAEDGEVLVRGPQVFRGYWNAPEATAQTLVDGWLVTGDLGTATDRGDLVITGRKKELIVTAGGKNVVPGVLEDRVRAHPLVDQCVVVGEGRPFVGALVFLDREEVQRRLARRGTSAAAGTVETAEVTARAAGRTHRVQGADRAGGGGFEAELHAEIDAAVAAANAAVSRGEAIRAYRIVDDLLSVSSGDLTPTQKLRRHNIGRRFAVEIDAVYG